MLYYSVTSRKKHDTKFPSNQHQLLSLEETCANLVVVVVVCAGSFFTRNTFSYMSKRYASSIFRPNKIVMVDDSTVREIEWSGGRVVRRRDGDRTRYNPRLVAK